MNEEREEEEKDNESQRGFHHVSRYFTRLFCDTIRYIRSIPLNTTHNTPHVMSVIMGKFIVLLLLLLLTFSSLTSASMIPKGMRSMGGQFVKKTMRSTSSNMARYHQTSVDHFNSSDQRMWNQAYYVNDTYFNLENESAPVFLCVGGYVLSRILQLNFYSTPAPTAVKVHRSTLRLLEQVHIVMLQWSFSRTHRL
jgi:hypothetical protein